MNSKLKKYLTLFLLGMAGNTIYFLPYIKYYFYDAQIAAMGISNAQSGMLLTAYTIGNIILYIPGGFIADKVKPRWAIAISCASTGLLAFLYSATMSFTISLVIWLLFSVTTAFVFWAALMKAVRIIGDEKEQGFLYGFYYACNGIAGLIASSITLHVFNSKNSDVAGFHAVVNTSGMIMITVAILAVLLLKDNGSKTETTAENKFRFADLGYLLKQPVVWVISVVIFCGYGVFSNSTYFTPYLSSVCGLDTSKAAFVAIIRQYGLLLLAPIGGLIADKVFKNTAKWLACILFVIGLLYFGMLLFGESTNANFAVFYSLLVGACCMMMYGTVFSLMSGAGIPVKYTGTAIGIASIIGYLPDSFFAVMFGNWLDTKGAATGYSMIFTFLGATAVVGAFLAIVAMKLSHKNKNQTVTE
ncbi:sugar phosphate permease [Desulfosporosinus orientis DSM 765]|uniref:Sugar phosphate permease n=1 Tax=Desulfosporosinus orientis (strain ATCC 19365 / DSM 765 / NCIMB 8382 / VKM B-1628 / Singapore I) TaxID=768706 RepID=G7WB01_DESOD|nr:MFS transporter [Desulfosporosinus orientis]AET67502.1 sugar phosphate permease [Desulfosporosinus orientis DSM 765]